MTSLAAQLKKLAVPDTQNVLSSGLRQASFLYDAGEAATYDKQHFYNIGINGLQQLIEKDESFEEFEQNLFAPSSQSLQRFVQTTEVNKQLDESITTFLLRLSPYMQLREAHKAMEWMVHRYNVHLRNVNVFMMCVLPYHDQQPFIRALRLLKLNSNECAMWRWLEPVKKGETFLARQTLVTHCRSAKGFLGFICDMLTKHIDANRDESGIPSRRRLEKVIGFYIQTVLGVIISEPPSEHILSTLIPAISAGLKSHDLPDHMTSSYMILGQLLANTTLESSLLKSLLNVVCKNIQPGLLHAAMSVIVLMFQKQNIEKIPRKSFKYLVRHSNLASILTVLSREATTEPFLTPFMSMLTQGALNGTDGASFTSDSNPDNDDSVPLSLLSLLLNIMTIVNLETKTVAVTAREVLAWCYYWNLEGEIDGDMPDSVNAFQIFKLLENRFSSTLESVVKDMTSVDDDSDHMELVVKRLYRMSIKSAQEGLRTDAASTLTLCLHHHNKSVRKSAVTTLLQDTELIEDKETMQSALVSRLQDESLGVVAEVLQKPQALWELFDDKKLLEETLYRKLSAMKKSCDGTSLILRALLCAPQDVLDETKLLSVILSFLVPMPKADLSLIVEIILESPFAARNNLLKHLQAKWLPVVNENIDVEERHGLRHGLMEKLVDRVTDHLLMDDTKQALKLFEDLYANVLSSPRPVCVVFVLCVSALNLALRSKSSEEKIKFQHFTVSIVMDATLNKGLISYTKSSEDLILNSCLDHMSSSGKLPLDIISHLLENLNMDPPPAGLKAMKFWRLSGGDSSEDKWLLTMTNLTSLLLELAASRKPKIAKLARNVFSTVFKVLGDKSVVLRFLCWLWMAGPAGGVTAKAKAHILQFSQVFYSSLTSKEKAGLTTDPAPSLPCLLHLLSSEFEREREISFTMLATLTGDLGADAGCYKWTADNLLRYKEEILKDASFLPQVLKNILENDDAALAPPSPKKRRKSSSKIPPSSVALSFLLEVLLNHDTTDIVKASLLRVFSRLDTAESFLTMPTILKQLLSKANANVSSLSNAEKEMIVHILRRYTVTIAGCLEDGSESLICLQEALSSTLVVHGDTTVQMLTIEQLSSKLMNTLPYPARQTLVAQLLNIICTTSSSEVGRRCRKIIKKMRLEASLVVDELKSITAKPLPTTVRESKIKKKVEESEESMETVFESLPWKRIVTLLELIQSKKKLSEPVLVIPHLFQLLARILELEDGGSGEYLKQLVLGTIYNICEKGEKEQDSAVKGEHLNMELVVQCIRSSDNPHTHQQALLLLSAAAQIAPTLLLHNMMTVFTFMGASILRQDDSYSFHVIGRILENVIPALVMACEQRIKQKGSSKKKGVNKLGHVSSEEMMTVVLRVFVEAMPHVPAHRRMLLCEKLMSVLGADNYLWRLLLLFLERVTVKPTITAADEDGDRMHVEEEKTSGPISASDLEFLGILSEKFSCTQLLQCFTHALNYVSQLPEEKIGTSSPTKSKETLTLEEMTPEDIEIFSVTNHTAKQLRHFKFATVFAIRELVAGQYFVAEMSSTDPSSFLSDFQSLMETTLRFISQVTQSHDTHKEDNSSRFWRILLHKCHDFMDGLVNLLPDEIFLDVVSGLMQHKLSLVQRRALELLNTKLIYFKENVADIKVDLLTSMTDKLQGIVKKTLQRGQLANKKEEETVIGQAALFGLKVLCRILGEKHHPQFMQVLELCTSVLSAHHKNGMIAASTMLCIAEIVSTCKVHTLSLVGTYVPLIVSQLQSEEITQHEMLLLAAMSALQKIIEAVPLFLSPYLLDITIQLCLISSQLEASTGVHKPVVAQKVKLICTSVATVIPTRTFLPVLEKSFVALESNMAACVACAMSMLRDHVVKMSREDLTTFCQDLLQFFLVCFDLRVTHKEIIEGDLDTIEECVIDAFVSLVFKLSEAQFKPMLIQLYGWATDEEASRDRVLVFYRLCHCLAVKLKNLFTLFAGHILKHSAETLDLNNKTKQKVKYFGKGKESRRKSCRLLVYITDCLQQTFAHDTEGFVTKERFDIVMQPLVDQLENDFGKDSVCEERISKHLVPCIGSLAAAAQDDSLWKDMNYQILLKTRHEDPKVKIWSLSAVDAFHKQLGEDYTQLVPETIPFLAELMEDESDEVEKQTQKVLAAMETSVGENLQEYF